MLTLAYDLSIQIGYGRMVACFQTDKRQYVVLAPYAEVGEVNKQDCGLLKMLSTFIHIEPRQIVQTISIIHECTDNCKILRSATITAEREQTTTDKYYSLSHDYHTHLYCINIYCMSFVPL